jgi:hypothetical protein
MAVTGGWGVSRGTLTNIHPEAVVYVKQFWTDDWIWLPYLYPQAAEWVAAPGVSSATLQFDYGKCKKPDMNEYLIYDWNNINGWYVSINTYDYYGEHIIWVGVIETEEDTAFGDDYPGGRQVFQAYGLEHLLDRDEIAGSFTEDGAIDKAVAFNRRGTFGPDLRGNRSFGVDGNGIFLFSIDGYEWSNLQIGDHILYYHTSVGITFQLTGDLEILTTIFEEHHMEGLTIRQALNRLIDRRRGVGWVIDTTGSGTVNIFVFSLFSVNQWINNTLIYANSEPWYWNFTTDRALKPRYRFDVAEQYDIVKVLGGSVRTCCTFAWLDGTLLGSYTAGEYLDYRTGSLRDSPTAEDHDIYRKSDKLADVFVKLSVPKDWDWFAGNGEGSGDEFNVVPYVWDDGTVDYDTLGNAWNAEKVFDRSIPLLEDTEVSNAEPEYRRPLAVVFTAKEATEVPIASSTDADPIVVTTTGDHDLLTDDEVTISGHEINDAANGVHTIVVLTGTTFSLDVAGSGEGAGSGGVVSTNAVVGDWQYIDKLSVDDEEVPMSFRISDRELAVYCKGQIGHIAGLGWFRTEDISIASSTDADPIVVTTTNDHNLNTGMQITIADHETNVAANGVHTIIPLSAKTFELIGVAGSGAGAGSGGQINSNAEPSNFEPKIDFEDIAVTAMIETDSRLQVWEYIGAGVGDGTRVKIIRVEGTEFWGILEGTILDIIDGDVLESSGEVIRDDTPSLRAVARLAAGWYATERNTIAITVRGITQDSPVGSMITHAFGHSMSAPINTVVSKQKWDFRGAITQITTGYDELAFEDLESI